MQYLSWAFQPSRSLYCTYSTILLHFVSLALFVYDCMFVPSSILIHCYRNQARFCWLVLGFNHFSLSLFELFQSLSLSILWWKIDRRLTFWLSICGCWLNDWILTVTWYWLSNNWDKFSELFLAVSARLIFCKFWLHFWRLILIIQSPFCD